MRHENTGRWWFAGLLVVCAFLGVQRFAVMAAEQNPPPTPTVVQPGATNDQPPSYAIVLFDGTDLSKWSGKDGQPGWKVEHGYVEVVKKSGPIWTKQSFGDCQLHIEFATPDPPTGQGQGRGNSGVYLQGRYEVQVLDSYHSTTYANGQCGAIYGNHPPLVNACRPPGQWQTYDILFFAPRFDPQGHVIEKPRMTVLQNGVLIQHNADIKGPTTAARFNDMQPTGPLLLQDHGHPVRYRNIWIRRL